jgi:carbamoylphosphate synthase small subunit
MEVRRVFVVFLVAISTISAHAQSKDADVEQKLSRSTRLNRPADRKLMPKIALRIYDFDQVAPTAIAGAKDVVSEVFRESGLQVLWVDCPSENRCAANVQGPEFRLRIVPASFGKEMVSDEALGFAVPCAPGEPACLFYIFYWRINALAGANHVIAGRILGHVLAHEIGHTLLGPNAHIRFGLMQHNLPLAETERTLYFTSGQAKQLRANLLARDAALRNTVLSNAQAESVAPH